MDKTVLLKAILDELKAELALQTEAALSSREEATNEESRAEDKHDMRGQSAAYLAAGQARMAGEIGEAIEAYQSHVVHPFSENDPIAIGALVKLKAKSGSPMVYFFGPQRGGLEVKVDGVTVIVVTGSSPLGRQLLGKRVGEVVSLPGRTGPLAHTIISVE